MARVCLGSRLEEVDGIVDEDGDDGNDADNRHDENEEDHLLRPVFQALGLFSLFLSYIMRQIKSQKGLGFAQNYTTGK